jgi:hypothetical protein
MRHFNFAWYRNHRVIGRREDPWRQDGRGRPMPSLVEEPLLLQHRRYQSPIFDVEGDVLEVLTAQGTAENGGCNLGL